MICSIGDLFNLICDRATLMVAWHRVISNRGARTAGVDHVTREVALRRGRNVFLEDLRYSLRDDSFRPVPARQTAIPKRAGKVRYLGIATLPDRVAPMVLKMMLEPVFEPDFYASSYGYRPSRRPQHAIAEIHHFCKPSTYEWVIQGDLTPCFDAVDHKLLMQLVRERFADRQLLRFVPAFLPERVVEQHGGFAASLTATPQGGIMAPLLANIYLSVLDRHFHHTWETEMSPRWRCHKRRQKTLPNYQLVRYADDFVVLVDSSREDIEALRHETGRLVDQQMKMTLSADKTLITHIDDRFNFLGFSTSSGSVAETDVSSC